jgi:phosphatidylserine/phosphatidylglycerophosphate/cardiolipin synthase-like enzyme
VTWLNTTPDLTANYASIYNWLVQQKRFEERTVPTVLANPAALPDSSRNNPILRGTVHQAIIKLIAEARETIFLDIFLLGGTWGTEIVRQLLLATQRGVEVVILHDTETPFAARREMEPLWLKLVEYAKREQKFTALRSQVHHRPRPFPLAYKASSLLFLIPLNKEMSL